ncbi:MAG: FAD-dependent oxidoreductase [Dehalococcoidales bacterium]|nr:FAD-dependent oxidoreductase [Dehalococcoidales bacterium]
MIKTIKNVEELKLFHEQAKAKADELESQFQVKVHMGSCGIASGAEKVYETFIREMEKRKLPGIVIQKAACIGLCDIEPVVSIFVPDEERVIYYDVNEEKALRIIEDHLLRGKPVTEWVFDSNSPRMKLQETRVMQNQYSDPADIEMYMAHGGYLALAKALTQMRPNDVISEVLKSGLRGRGGAGFPTARKWEYVRVSNYKEKHVVCNGDEGDPGAYMNRTVMEGNPHSIIEGMAIGAYAIGDVRQGYAYIRAEYPLAIETLKLAISQAMECGLLGKNILGTGFDFFLDIFPGAGAFVCGEETALLTSIEGRRGNPRQRPPFPSTPEGGLLGKPTTLNNVETWSNVPLIILKGADWFSQVGNEKCKGTKTLCLVGKINNPGLVEVPLGISLGQLIFDIGGGIPNGKKFKAVQLGGPSGGVIPIEHINTPVDYEAIPSLGAIMGSGGVVVMDENSCMVDVAKFFLEFNKDESCGKCTPCRAGIPQMLAILNRISRGEGKLEDLDTLLELGETISNASLCGLGQTSANPVLTTLRYFREEYEAHIIDKHCPASFCRALFKSPCQHTCPVELDIPGYAALIKAGRYADAYALIKQRNPLPSVCGRVCHHPCELKCNRTQIDQPIAIRELKRFAADWALEHDATYIPRLKPGKNKKVAIIGAGPAGLAAAWDLAIEGYQVTIFESLPVAGGMMATAIPEYRMPRDILQKEIKQIEDLGVEIKLNFTVNYVKTLLQDSFQAVFIATGAHQGTKLGIPGENLEGVYDAIHFLKEVNLGHDINISIGKKVAVIGGGNSAIDSARIALRKGAEEVHIFYRRQKDDMPAEEEEVKAALDEGIIFHFLTNPLMLSGDERVTGMEVVQMEVGEIDRSGRKVTRPVPGSEFTVEVDTVIAAIGQKPETSFININEIQIAKDGTIVADKRTLATGRAGVFAGGDVVTGPKTVIEAIAQGQRAACSIHRFLEGQELIPMMERHLNDTISVPQEPTSQEELKEKARAAIREIDVEERKNTFKEVTLTFSEEEARQEASRCMRCDLDLGG